MKLLSKERNLLLGLFLGAALAITVPHLTSAPEELVASTGQEMECTGQVDLDTAFHTYGQIHLVCEYGHELVPKRSVGQHNVHQVRIYPVHCRWIQRTS